MGIIFIIIGGIIGYQVGSRMTTTNWGMKILHALWPAVAIFLFMMLISAASKDPWAAYNAVATITPGLMAAIVYALFILFMMKIVKDKEDVSEVTDNFSASEGSETGQNNVEQTSVQKEDNVSSCLEGKVYLRKSNGSKVRQCGLQDGKKLYEDIERKTRVGFIEDDDLMEYNDTVDSSPEEQKHSNDWIVWIVVLLLIGFGIKAFVSYQEKQNEKALQELLEKNPDLLRY